MNSVSMMMLDTRVMTPPDSVRVKKSALKICCQFETSS